MTDDVRTEPRPGPGTVAQIFGWAGGMTFYALHLLIGTSLVPAACAAGSTWPVHLATGVAVAGILASSVVAWRVRAAARQHREDRALATRRELLGTTGLLLNALALVVVIYAEVPQHVLSPCLP